MKIVEDYGAWMTGNDLPKLFVDAEPGALVTGAVRDFCRSWKNQSEVTVPDIHFIQEDAPDEIGQALAGWLRKLR